MMSPAPSASSAMDARAVARAERRELRMRRVLSFTGVAPLGAFVVVHTITTATALYGSARFDRVFGDGSRALAALTWALVLAPLAFHAVYGTVVALSPQKRIGAPELLPRLRRAAALVTFAFLAFHVYDVPGRLWTAHLSSGALHDLLSAELSSTFYGFPLRAVAYMVGLAATAFHFATSLWSFCTTWGVIATFRAQRVTAWAFSMLGVVLFAVGANTVVFFATGARLIAPRPAPLLDGVSPHSPCPANPVSPANPASPAPQPEK